MSTERFRGTTSKWKVLLTSASLLVLLAGTVSVAFAQGNGSGGGGTGGGGTGGGGKPGGGETTTGSNLSYPANFYKTSLQAGVVGSYDFGALFPGGVSYGCLVPEIIGTTTYPNTSCVATDGTPQDYTTCQTKCTGLGATTVERIYWQKNAYNMWQAGYATSTAALPVSYIDWGDNLESKSWPVGILRVETNTFSTMPAATETNNPRIRFDMWHVFGQGTNELWGVHTSDADPPVPYVYVDAGAVNWPYGVNVSSTARLNLAKLATGGATCPTGGTGLDQSPYQGAANFTWNPTTGSWVGVPYFKDAIYGAELSIKGSYVYGYNWSLKTEAVPPDVGKTGWWRLTFYTPDKSVDFTNFVAPTALDNTFAPPASATSLPSLLPAAAAVLLVPQAPVILPAAETTGSLYVPEVDKTNQLTYLDICILEGKGGGGGKGHTK